MKDRIEEIMQKIGVSSSQFAKIIGMKQASLSHILTGRNNPSLDVVMKINQAFPDINLKWLLYGEGEMGTPNYHISDTNENEEISDSENEYPIFPKSMLDEFSTAEQRSSARDSSNIGQKTNVPTRKVVEIRVFYNDGTYETFLQLK